MSNASGKVAVLEKKLIRSDIPEFTPGDTVRVHVKIKEGDKERVQVFEGTVIAFNGTGSRRMFTVRKMSHGVGVERVFPLHSPNIAKIERADEGRVRRAKIYYVRKLSGKAARIRSESDVQ
jgi:large subunit ribosomal protein L19